MRVIKRQTLVQFWRRHPETEEPLRAWFAIARRARWTTPASLKDELPKVSLVGKDRAVFDICGGNYRLVVAIHYSARIVFVKFLGTHAQYDRIDANTVDRY
ncbi:MAG TPA: type II toxin-antitoxin system HigB family toxin [Thermoanaerobaculia bacterium]|nr:type II toxin-antitoxin system HigB family toxin [Thermoanaerobaculia bacterium]